MLRRRPARGAGKHIGQARGKLAGNHGALESAPVAVRIDLEMVGQQRSLLGGEHLGKPRQVAGQKVLTGGAADHQQVIDDANEVRRCLSSAIVKSVFVPSNPSMVLDLVESLAIAEPKGRKS